MTPKRKNDLLTTLNHIERYHRRRMVLTIHAVISLAAQLLIWANWYGSYASQGRGFEGTFFTDRLSFSLVLGLFIIAHAVIVHLSEAKDRAVVQAIQAYDMDAELIESAHNRLSDDDYPAEYEEAEIEALAARRR